MSLSTTLATNAVVEGGGGRIGSFMIGFDAAFSNEQILPEHWVKIQFISSQAVINLMVVFRNHWILPH